MKQQLHEGYAFFKDLYAIIDRRTGWLTIATVLVGFLQFGAELALALSLQALFHVMGLISNVPELLTGVIPYDNAQFIVMLFLVVGLARSLLIWFQSYVTGIVVVNCETAIRLHVVDFGINNRKAASGTVTDLFNDKAIGASNFVSSVLNLVGRLTIAGLMLISLFGMSFSMTVLMLACLGLLILPMRLLSIRIHRNSDSLHRDITATIDRLLAGIRNNLLLHIYGTRATETDKTVKSLKLYQQAYKSYYILSGLKGILPSMAGIIMVTVIAWMSRETSSMSPALLVSYLYLLIRFVATLGELANLGSYLTLTGPRAMVVRNWWRDHYTDGETVSPLLVHQQEKTKEAKTQAHLPDGPSGWQLSKVSLTYEGQSQPVLDEMTLTITPGTAQAFVGESGSGKSSLLNLLLGLNHPTGGEISVIDQTGASHPLSFVHGALLKRIGYVGPDSFLVSGTIRDNLLYGIEHQEDAALLDALAMAECDFVQNLTDGLDHMLTEQGEGLSAGQKQRLGLARALVRKPQVLVLDEATANLDEATEQRLIETLGGLKGLMTLCLVTHRKNMLVIADDILYLSRK